EESKLWILTVGLIVGILALDLIEKNVPHIDIERYKSVKQFDTKSLLVIIALFLHNIPEGLSTGFSYASENEGLGPMIAIAIGAQNIPEGLILAVFLIQSSVSKLRAILIVTITGLVEVVSAIVGYFTAAYISWLIGFGLSFAAGAMLFIVYKELIPETHGHGYERPATYSFIIGLIVMIYISYFFG